jgi:hypothetical protein
VIQDDDYPSTERYIVKITKRGSPATTQTLRGDQRTFTVKVTGPTGPGAANVIADTIIVSIKDSTGTVDTNRLFLRYPISTLSTVKQLSLSLDASVNVTTGGMYGGARVSMWTDQNNAYGTNVAQQEYNRQPSIVTSVINKLPAILFDHQTNTDNGLFTSSYLQWADTPFTVFVVFAPRTLSSKRQTLVSTNTADGFGIGIGCDSTIGIFNDITGDGCSEAASTGLVVAAKTWYVASFRSALGIPVNGSVNVSAWLNNKPASGVVSLRTMSDAGLSIGTGSGGSDWGFGGAYGGYDGSFDGWIAAVAIYLRALSDDERFLVENYLAGRYGIKTR